MSGWVVGKKALVFVEPVDEDGDVPLMAIVLVQAAHAVTTAEKAGMSLDGVVFTVQRGDERIVYRLEDA